MKNAYMCASLLEVRRIGVLSGNLHFYEHILGCHNVRINSIGEIVIVHQVVFITS